jgi:hypothetical protein
MSKSRTVLALLAICGAAVCQVSFECAPLGAFPGDPTLNCEGVASNNAGAGTAVSSNPSCFFPTNGTQYAYLVANGPGYQVPPNFPGFFPPVGGPFPRPCDPLVTELRVPVPAGAAAVQLDWEFFNVECANLNYYDGMSIDIVDAAGNLVQNLVYVDTLSPEGPCAEPGTDFCGGPVGETMPAGINSLVAVLNPFPACSYLSVAIWNGNDNAAASHGYVDNIVFTGGAAPCPVPCFIPGLGAPTLAFSSPSGVGCIRVDMSNMPALGTFFMPVVFNAGNYPMGWFFGIDPTFPELAASIAFGYPFIGPIGGTPCSPGTVVIGEFCGVPSGLTLYAVALGIPIGASYPTAVTNPQSYTIP